MTKQRQACDVCGRAISGKPQFRFFEGARLMVCDICARFAEKQPPKKQGPKDYKPRTPKPARKRRTPRRSLRDLEIHEDYAKIIRSAREKKGWTQKELSKQLLERLSLIRRIENAKMQPNVALAEKLEKKLGITLFVSTSDIPEVKMETKLPSDMTLGDVVHLKTKKQRDED